MCKNIKQEKFKRFKVPMKSPFRTEIICRYILLLLKAKLEANDNRSLTWLQNIEMYFIKSDSAPTES